MNALEIADDLQTVNTAWCSDRRIGRAVTMLRTLHADKEQLEFALINSETAYTKLQAENDLEKKYQKRNIELQAKITKLLAENEALRKQLKNACNEIMEIRNKSTAILRKAQEK